MEKTYKPLLTIFSIIIVVGAVVIFGAAVIQTWTADLTREFLPQFFKMVETIVAIVAILAFGPNWIRLVADLRKPKNVSEVQRTEVVAQSGESGEWGDVQYVQYGTRR